jgi:IS30 family transposase
MRVSHETIYLSLFVQARGALRKELFRCLRTGRARRRPRGLTVMNGQGKIRGMVNIAERPAEAAGRAVPGHWEGDIIFGTGRGGHRRAQPGRHHAAGPATPVPDMGPGQGDGRARPVQPGDRHPGVLLRPAQPLAARQQREHERAAAPVVPRSTGFKAVTQSDLDQVAAELNDRPRQTLKWKSPCQALDEALR